MGIEPDAKNKKIKNNCLSTSMLIYIEIIKALVKE